MYMQLRACLNSNFFGVFMKNTKQFITEPKLVISISVTE